MLLSGFLAVFIIIISFLSVARYPAKVLLGNKLFYVEVSDTEYLMKKGLSGHKPLGTNEGMLFVFTTDAKHGIWMKDMLFSIDIIWFDKDMRIVHIEKSVSPDTYPKVFEPKEDARYVLEISAGQSTELGLRIGDKIQFLSKDY